MVHWYYAPEDGYPSDSRSVLIINKDGDTAEGSYALHNETWTQFRWSASIKKDDVKYWAELPKKPTDTKENDMDELLEKWKIEKTAEYVDLKFPTVPTLSAMKEHNPPEVWAMFRRVKDLLNLDEVLTLDEQVSLMLEYIQLGNVRFGLLFGKSFEGVDLFGLYINSRAIEDLIRIAVKKQTTSLNDLQNLAQEVSIKISEEKVKLDG